MKPNINFFFILIFTGLLVNGTTAHAIERTKKYNEQWPVNDVQTLRINNSFGNINITDKGGEYVTIDVVVTVEASNEKRANDILGQIDVRFGKTGSTVTAVTSISRNFSSRQRFSIDYEVNIPPGKNLQIENKYGNTFINELNVNGDFDIQYGNITINELNTPKQNTVSLRLKYGKSDIQNARDIAVSAQYSRINIGTLNDIKLNSKYNVLNIEKAGLIAADSQYDTFNFGIVNSLQADTRYTQTKVEVLQHSLNLEAAYGGVRIGQVNSGFNSVSVTSSYGQISLGLGNADYSLDANCEYCGVSYPENRFSGNRISENNRRTIRGKVGDGPGGSVLIKSRYGEIRLN